ncbi:unnamed protein product [Arctogadus glacialis]
MTDGLRPFSVRRTRRNRRDRGGRAMLTRMAWEQMDWSAPCVEIGARSTGGGGAVRCDPSRRAEQQGASREEATEGDDCWAKGM